MASLHSTKFDRRTLLLGSLALGASSFVMTGCASGASDAGAAGGTVNWLTWSDHFSNDQLKKVAASSKITGGPKLFSDNADALLQIKQTGSQFDIVSGDALWVKKYRQEGLIDPFQMDEIAVSKELYSAARDFSFLKDPQGFLGYPFSWSSVQIYFNPKLVKTPPTSWESLTDPAYKGLIVAENIPTDLLAIGGIATGSKEPYALKGDGLTKAADFLKALKPNMIKLASQNNEIISMLASGEAAIGISNLGTDLRVKAAGGPQIEAAYPTEGTIGFIDAEMITSKGAHQKLVRPFLNAMETSEYIVENFKTNGRPLFNEKAANILLNDPKTAQDAKRLFMGNPEKALAMTLKGPAENQQSYTEAFNQIFGA
jgi:spermidine/putrescine-binding protein